MMYRISSEGSQDWEGNLDDLLKANPDLDEESISALVDMEPGHMRIFCLGEEMFTIMCLSFEDERPKEDAEYDSEIDEKLARCIETLMEELRRRGATIDCDLSAYEEYRARHPREDA